MPSFKRKTPTTATQPQAGGKGQTPSNSFIRPTFTFRDPKVYGHSHLVTLPDLVEFNATHNSQKLFCLQFHRNIHAAPCSVTFEELHYAVLRCSTWLAGASLVQAPKVQDGDIVKTRPVALLMSSDVNWFIVFLALLRVGVPVLSLSTHLSPQATVHLLMKTSAQAVLTSPQVQHLVDETIASWPQPGEALDKPVFIEAPTYDAFMRDDQSFDVSRAPSASRIFNGEDRNVFILHSSGTTGLPKPIYHSHAYLLGYAACHCLSPSDVHNALNVSTLPLYHGFGLLAPSLALSTGMSFVLPAATTISTGNVVLALLRSAQRHSRPATSLMTVPSILEEAYLLPDTAGVEALKSLRFVAVGGAAMKSSVAEPLASAGVPLLNHWGVTEIGAIAPIVIPSLTYDWRYLRLRDDIRLRIEPVREGDTGRDTGRRRLVGCPPGSCDEFTVQDLLETNPAAPDIEFRIAGRADDLIVLANGEKIRPIAIESTVAEHPLVRAALVFGDGRFQIGLIVECAAHMQLDLQDDKAVEEYVSEIWATVERANEEADTHARMVRDMLVVTTPRTRPLVRTPKGSIPRSANVQLFREEIENRYRQLQDSEQVPGARLPEDEEGLLGAIRSELCASVGRPVVGWSNDDDFFERGMNSLQATVLRRRLAMRTGSTSHEALPKDFIYANPTIAKLTQALRAVRDGTAVPDSSIDRCARMEAIVIEYTKKMETLPEPAYTTQAETQASNSHSGGGLRVLLIGSTGSLGGATLSALLSSTNVDFVYALNRRGQTSLRERQERTFRTLGVDLGDKWKKIVLFESGSELHDERFGLGEREYEELRGVTHIFHNAWPMDFNHKVDTFHAQFELVLNIVKFATSWTGLQPLTLLFSSSIAAVGNHQSLTASSLPIKEAPYLNPGVTEHFGYAEAKWVCERLYAHAAALFPRSVSTTAVRIGQLTGCTATSAWSRDEHFPMIVKSCRAVGKVPLISGDASWIPVDIAGIVIAEMIAAKAPLPHVMHLENPQRQPWRDILLAVGEALGIAEKNCIPFSEWLHLVEALPDPVVNPASKIIEFLEDSFIRLAAGTVVLDTTIAQSVSPTLRTVGGPSDEVVLGYMRYWKRTCFLE